MKYIRKYLGNGEDTSELERVLEIFNSVKQLKYLYDEKSKLVPIDRISKIGRGICYDQARYQSSLAKKYNLTSRTFFYVCYVDGELAVDDISPGDTHAENYILVDDKWYVCDTTGRYKQLNACDKDQLDIVLANEIKSFSMDIFPIEIETAGTTGKDISSVVASYMIEYFKQAINRVSWQVYEIPEFHDKKFDGMTYKKLAEYVASHYSPHEFDDRIIEGIRTNDPRYDKWAVLKPIV